MSYKHAIIDGTLCLTPNGKANGHAPRRQVAAYFSSRRQPVANLSYDAARTGTDLDNHWAFADALDADCANNRTVRHRLMHRSRYEAGSNGYYEGIIKTHCNMLVGIGPNLRMLTGNRNFNQLVEREWFKWTQAVQLRRKLWAMAYARTADGEVFALLQTNPAVRDGVQLDFLPIEAEQCQTPYLPHDDRAYIDGIKRDEFGNVEWYDILPYHPGSSQYAGFTEAERVSPSQVLHWFKLKRPGSSRGTPDMTSTLPVGASSRRHREATVAAAETAADFAALLKSTLPPDEAEAAASVMSTYQIAKRMMTVLPDGYEPTQMKAEHPNATYADFHRQQVSETSRPLSMPYNLAACDSSTYSFASGKLDTLAYRAALDVERHDANDIVLDPLFAAWFREWTIVADKRDIPPAHQWDWPAHPVIDAVAEENAKDTKLKNGTLTFRQACSDSGRDAEDEYVVMAEDLFGEANEQSIAKCRQIVALKNTPQHAIQYVASILGVQPAQQPQTQGAPANE